MIFILQVQDNFHAAFSLKALIILAKSKPFPIFQLVLIIILYFSRVNPNGQRGLVHHVILMVLELSNLFTVVT